MRNIQSGAWEQAQLEKFSKMEPGSAVCLCDGRTLEVYAGAVPNDWNGKRVYFFDCFESQSLKHHHPDLYQKVLAEQ